MDPFAVTEEQLKERIMQNLGTYIEYSKEAFMAKG